METPYGRGHDAPLRSLDRTDDASLRVLVTVLAVGILGQVLSVRYCRAAERPSALPLT